MSAARAAAHAASASSGSAAAGMWSSAAGGDGRPDAGQQLHDAEAGDAVARVLGEPQQRQHVLDVRRFEKLQAAEFDEGNVAPGQLDFERTAVVRGAEQHRLLL